MLRSKKTLIYQDNHHHHNLHQLSFTMPPHCSHGRYLNHQRTKKRRLAALMVALRLPGLGLLLVSPSAIAFDTPVTGIPRGRRVVCMQITRAAHLPEWRRSGGREPGITR